MVSQYPQERTFHCLSTDDKPTTDIRNGDKLIEMDTSKTYFYDTDGNQWIEFTLKVSTS